MPRHTQGVPLPLPFTEWCKNIAFPYPSGADNNKDQRFSNGNLARAKTQQSLACYQAAVEPETCVCIVEFGQNRMLSKCLDVSQNEVNKQTNIGFHHENE